MARAVRLYHGSGCGLCGPALDTVRRVCADTGAPLEVVDITGDADLEARYRTRIPTVEIDGHAAFTYFVDEHELRGLLA